MHAFLRNSDPSSALWFLARATFLVIQELFHQIRPSLSLLRHMWLPLTIEFLILELLDLKITTIIKEQCLFWVISRLFKNLWIENRARLYASWDFIFLLSFCIKSLNWEWFLLRYNIILKAISNRGIIHALDLIHLNLELLPCLYLLSLHLPDIFSFPLTEFWFLGPLNLWPGLQSQLPLQLQLI